MKKLIFSLFLFFCTVHLNAQNLITNPSFEDGLPDKTITTRNADGDAGRPFIPGWWVPNQTSPDIFNHHKSKANGVPVPKARTGKGFAGLVLAESKNLANHYGGSYKEYVQTELSQAMAAGKQYKVEFYVAADQSNAFYATNIGAYLSGKAITQKNKIGFDVVPQIKMEVDTILTSMNGWVKICGVYTAVGGEKFITIGSFGQQYMQSYRQINYAPKVERGHIFRNAYYFLDDVTVEELQGDELDCCIDKPEAEKNVLIAIDNFDDYFIGENRAVLLEGLNNFFNLLPDYFKAKIIIRGCRDEQLIFQPITEFRTNLESVFNKLKITDYSNDLNKTLTNYLGQIERDSILGVHVVQICAGKMSTGKKIKEQITTTYAKNGTTFSVIQVNGKYSNATHDMVSKVKGEYLYSDLKTLKTQCGQMGNYIGNNHNRLTYAPRANLKVYFILGAVAILALATAAVL